MIGPGSLVLPLWIGAVAALALGLRGRRTPQARPPAGRAPLALRLAAALPVGGLAGRLGDRSGSERLLRAAGVADVLTPAWAAQARTGSAVLGAGAALVAGALAPAGLVLAPLLAVAGYLAPDAWLRAAARRRRQTLIRELPDLLDLLGICVESGMALDPALRVAAARLPGLLSAELRMMLRELALGIPRREAYESLAVRGGTPELTQVVGALLQAEELGAPLSGALTEQSTALRAQRRQLARDRAARAAPKIQLVVTLLMVPGALVLVLGVMLLELAHQVGAVVAGP